RKHRLRAFPLVTAPETVDIAGRSSPAPFERRVTFFGGDRSYADLAHELFFIEAHPGKLLAFLLAQWLNLVVETGDLDLPLLVDQGGQHFPQRIGGIGHCSAKRAGMKILLRTGQSQFEVSDSFQTIRDRRFTWT